MKALQELSKSDLVICASFDIDGNTIWSNAKFDKLFKNALASTYKNMVLPSEIDDVKKACAFCRKHPGKLYPILITAKTISHHWSVFAMEIFYNEEECKFGVWAFNVGSDKNAVKAFKMIESDENVNHFRYMLSHEVRPYVANILGLTSLIEVENSPDEIRKMSMSIQSQTKSLDKVIRKMVMLIKNSDEE